MLERYGVEYYTSSSAINKMRNSKEIQEKIQNTKREHNTFNKSEPEEELFKYLCDIYGENNVIRQYKDLERYPFNCDFYIKSEDLFIELNLFPTHGTEPFDATNKNHAMLLEHCKQNPSNWIEQQFAGDFTEDKPHPMAAHAVFDNNLPEADSILVIGDGMADYSAARTYDHNGKTAPCIIYDPKGTYTGGKPTLKVSNLKDIIPFLKENK